jgi:hypothetical protein
VEAGGEQSKTATMRLSFITFHRLTNRGTRTSTLSEEAPLGTETPIPLTVNTMIDT